MPGFLTNGQVEELKQAHRGTRDRKAADRIKAVLYLNRGFSYLHTADLLMLDETTLGRYKKQYQEKGLNGLLELRYRGTRGQLTPDQEYRLGLHLDVQLYSTVKEVAGYVQKTYKVKYSIQGLTHLLHRIGFGYKQTKLVPGKADAVRQKAFIRLFKRVKKELAEDDQLYFVDATHPVHNTRPGYAWIRVGKIAPVPANTGRKRLNLSGALNAKTHKAVVLSEKTIDFQASINLGQKLLAKHPTGKIHLILDQASYYRSKEFRAWLKLHRRIRLHFLPPYSPNLNLIERLWGFMHKKVLVNHYYEKFSQFESAVLGFFKHLHRYRKQLDFLLTDSFQTLPALQLQT